MGIEAAMLDDLIEKIRDARAQSWPHAGDYRVTIVVTPEERDELLNNLIYARQVKR